MSFILEVAVFNIGSALLAAKAGADRIELCENPADGGTTPSYGTLKTVKEQIGIPVYPIVRPRGGDFLYAKDEFEVMKKDVSLIKDLGFDGVVIGLLKENGTVDVERTARLVDLAYPLEVTFHRAFDRAADPFEALEGVITSGCQRILTSGQVPNAFDGRELISQLIQQAAHRIIVMPGSGVRSNNILSLIEATGAEELHSSARKMIPSKTHFSQESMKENLDYVSVDVDEIKRMKESLKISAESKRASAK